MFKKGDRLKVKSYVTVRMLRDIGFDSIGAKQILADAMTLECDRYYGDDKKYMIHVLNYSRGCWIWKDWAQPQNEQLTFIFQD